MERIDGKNFERVESEFYLSYVSGYEFNNFSYKEGVRLYEELIELENSDYIMMISKKKVQTTDVEFDSDNDCYILNKDIIANF